MSTQLDLFQPHARRSDPLSSDVTVKSIARDGTLKALILDAAATFGLDNRRAPRCWNDTMIHARIEELTGRRFQRNVIARSRGLMERDDLIVRIGAWSYQGRPGVVHFSLPPTP